MTYAIFAIGSRQFRAAPGVTIKVPLLQAEPGSKVTFDRVLLASEGTDVHAGKPVLKGAKVTAEVVRHGKGDKDREIPIIPRLRGILRGYLSDGRPRLRGASTAPWFFLVSTTGARLSQGARVEP